MPEPKAVHNWAWRCPSSKNSKTNKSIECDLMDFIVFSWVAAILSWRITCYLADNKQKPINCEKQHLALQIIVITGSTK